MLSTSVVVPFRGGCPHREAAWQWVRSRYETTDWQVVVGVCPDGPWVKASAVADALNRADGDLLVIADADVWCDGLAAAVEHVEHEGGWAVPHGRVHRLDEASTAEVLAGGPLHGSCVQAPYLGHVGGGLVVIGRDLYEAHPFDPRFEGWGREDDALGLTLKTMVGRPWRGKPILWHLWHPPQQRPSRMRGHEATEDLFRRYSSAARRPDRMRTLIEEARAWQPQPSPSA